MEVEKNKTKHKINVILRFLVTASADAAFGILMNVHVNVLIDGLFRTIAVR